MKTTFSARHADVPDAIRQYVTSEVEGLSKFFSRLVEADIILDLEGHRHIAEARVHTSNDTHFARSEAGDHRTAIDDMVAKLRRQLKRHKGKLANHAMPHEERERIFGEAVSPGEPPEPDGAVAPEEWPRISVPEATARLETSGEDVLVFVDAVDGEVKIARRAGDSVKVEEAESFEAEKE